MYVFLKFSFVAVKSHKFTSLCFVMIFLWSSTSIQCMNSPEGENQFPGEGKEIFPRKKSNSPERE